MRILLRILAALCVFLSAFSSLLLPTSLLFSWMEITQGITALHEAHNGTPSFVEGQYRQIWEGVINLPLYILACIAIWGLIAIVFNLLSRRWQMIIWSFTFISGLGIALKHRDGMSASSDFVVMFIIIPAVVGVVGLFGLILTRAEKISSPVR